MFSPSITEQCRIKFSGLRWIRMRPHTKAHTRYIHIHTVHANMQSILGIHGSYVLQSCHKHWISKYWTIAPRRNIELGSFVPLVTTFSPTDQYLILFYVCFCLKTMFTLHCCFIPIRLTANITCAWTKLI